MRITLPIAALCLLPGIVACAPQPAVVTQPMDSAQDRLLKLAAAYRQVNLDRGAPPRSAAEIEPLLKSRGAGPEVFLSPRDGQPFVIAWGTEMVKLPVVAPRPTILAYEKLGKEGSRFVMMVEGNTRLLDRAEFAHSQFPPGHSPPRE